ncbi:MAG: 50S ribosomal protein L3 [Chloroflexi bacterium]|nr:50S ribosomal protein L3 [Chloroflexota bacterium]
MNSGIIGKKLGMAQVFKEGRVVPVTVIEAGPCAVVQVKTVEKDGYNAAQVGFGAAKRLNSAEKGHSKGLGQFRVLREFRLADAAGTEAGQKIDVNLFKVGEKVDITGASKGRGFAGGVRRYHFRGGSKTHGQSDRQRAPGSIGATTTPGRVFKGLRMAGHMGAARVKVRNLEIAMVEPERNRLLVRGAVPGARNGLLLIEKSAGRNK